MAMILLFGLAALIMSLVQHPYYRPKRGYGSPPLGISTGLMATALIPLVIYPGGKVNLITLLTGLGHEKLNVMHRYVGWIMFWLGTIHAIPLFVQEVWEGIVKVKFYKVGSYEFAGVPPYALAFGLAFLSSSFVRRKFYESFVVSHIAMEIVFFGLCFWHFGNQLDGWWYLWGATAVWLLQLLARLFWKSSSFNVMDDWMKSLQTTVTHHATDLPLLRLDVPAEWTWSLGDQGSMFFCVFLD